MPIFNKSLLGYELYSSQTLAIKIQISGLGVCLCCVQNDFLLKVGTVNKS